MATINLSILGPIQVRRSGRPVTLKAAKARALLAYLAITGGFRSRPQLMERRWSNSDVRAARKNLRNHLSLIRRALEDEALLVEADTVGLSEKISTDVSRFEMGLEAHLRNRETSAAELQRLLELWRGPLLENLRLSEAADFELWQIRHLRSSFQPPITSWVISSTSY